VRNSLISPRMRRKNCFDEGVRRVKVRGEEEE
jgi:hypothetical protein